MSMTRKHFEQFAARVAEHATRARQQIGEERTHDFAAGKFYACKELAAEFASIAQQDNPRFDSVRFFRACGLNQDHQPRENCPSCGEIAHVGGATPSNCAGHPSHLL